MHQGARSHVQGMPALNTDLMLRGPVRISKSLSMSRGSSSLCWRWLGGPSRRVASAPLLRARRSGVAGRQDRKWRRKRLKSLESDSEMAIRRRLESCAKAHLSHRNHWLA